MNKVNYPELWLEYPEIWNTKGAFFTWLRGSLRRAIWEKWPVKIQFKNENCIPVPEGVISRAKSGQYCALSGEWTGKSNLEVDHIVGNASLRDWSDFESFVLHLLATKSNMQLVSKEAHKVKSYAEKQGISFEEAMIEKKIIKMLKKENLKQTIDFIKSKGYTASQISNTKKRREVLRDILKGE